MQVFIKLKRKIPYVITLTLVFTLLTSFLMLSLMMGNVNKQIANSFHNQDAIKLVITGDINDITNGSFSDVDSYEETLNLITQLDLDLKENNYVLDGGIEPYLYTYKINLCENRNDPNNYKCGFLDSYYMNEVAVGATYDESLWMAPFNKVYWENKQYDSVQSYINDETINEQIDPLTAINPYILNHKDEKSFAQYQARFFPNIVGISAHSISDQLLGYSKMHWGEPSLKQEMVDGYYEAIVPKHFSIITKEDIHLVEVGDTFPITIEVIPGQVKTYHFKVVGIADGFEGNQRQVKGTYNDVYIEALDTMVYIPITAFNLIREDLLNAYNQNNYQPIKMNADGYILDGYHFSQYGGIRTIIYTLNSEVQVDEVVRNVQSTLDKINKINPNAYFKYTYSSSADLYASTVQTIQFNQSVFDSLLVIACGLSFILLCLITVFQLNRSLKEIGIKCALGMKKIQILGQLLFEYILLSIVPFIISIGITFSLTGAYSQKVISSFMIDRTKIAWNLFRKITNVFESFTVEFDWIQVCWVLGIWCVVLLAVMVVLAIRLRNVDPKTILLNE